MSEEEMLQIDGITPQVLATLRGNNVKTVEMLAMQKKSTLVDMGISESVAEKILEGAWKKLGYTWKPADKFLEDRASVEKFTTGSERLDELINGGFEARTLNEIAGEYGAGKTQTLFTTLVANLGKHPDYSAIFMDTEETFMPERVKEIAESRGYDAQDILKRTILARVISSEHYEFLVNKSDQLIKTRNIKLFLVDSLIAPLRAEYVGRETLAERQQILNRILRKLLNYAKLFNLAVIFTNQVVQSPTPYFGTDITRELIPTGGSILAHNATLRLFLRKAKEATTRIATVFDSPHIPPREIPIKITKKGIE
jgi:DNA repair protein RadA